jgi:hypothetical protein
LVGLEGIRADDCVDSCDKVDISGATILERPSLEGCVGFVEIAADRGVVKTSGKGVEVDDDGEDADKGGKADVIGVTWLRMDDVGIKMLLVLMMSVLLL